MFHRNNIFQLKYTGKGPFKRATAQRGHNPAGLWEPHCPQGEAKNNRGMATWGPFEPCTCWGSVLLWPDPHLLVESWIPDPFLAYRKGSAFSIIRPNWRLIRSLAGAWGPHLICIKWSRLQPPSSFLFLNWFLKPSIYKISEEGKGDRWPCTHIPLCLSFPSFWHLAEWLFTKAKITNKYAREKSGPLLQKKKLF